MRAIHLCVFACAVAMGAISAAAPVPPPPRNTPELELARLVGKWRAVKWQDAGEDSLAINQNRTVAIAADGAFAWNLGSSGKITRLDPTQKLKEIDYAYTAGGFTGQTQKGVYALEGDTLTECFARPGEARPDELKSTKENGWGLIVYTRVKKTD